MVHKKDNTQNIESQVVEVLEKLYGAALTYRQIGSRIRKGGYKNIKDYIPLLENLVKNGALQKLGRNKYFKPFKSAKITGRIDIKKTGQGYILSQDFPEEIVVESGMQNHALQGDLVEVAILAKRGTRVRGEVVRILERNKTTYAGILKVFKDFAFLITDYRKMHKDIFISLTHQQAKEWDGKKALVEITDWPDGAKNPFGKVVKILGNPGENEAEMNAIVAEFGFETDFPAETMAQSEAFPEEIAQDEIKRRLDLRSISTFTIDPATAKDFDDAISLREIGNDLFELGVHIADVSYYVPKGGAIDKEAQRRGTSVYLVDRTIPMLPPRLSEDLCSLNPNCDRPAFSAIFHIDTQGKVKKVKFAKTMIRSKRRFSYEEAQQILDSQKGDYVKELNIANQIAKNLRATRFKDGSMNFDSIEFKFELDGKGKPIGIKVVERGDTHFLIEEFMLLANKHVAAFGSKHYTNSKIPFVFRFHDQPNEIKLEDFKSFAAKWGYVIRVGNEHQIKTSINELMNKIKDKPEEGILSQLAIRSMAKATYTPYFSSHWGLGFETYTHFTSPIRRYPDLLVHRILFDILQGKKTHYPQMGEVEELCKKCSTAEQKAAEAERASVKYKQAEWMGEQIGKDFEGVISGVTDWGIFVELTQNKSEGLIKISSLKDDMYDYDEYNMQIVGRYYFKKHALGDKVIVRVKETNPLARTIDFTLIDNLSSKERQKDAPEQNRKQDKYRKYRRR
ncbi:MAG: ribonuclease R [Bacteroidia bacterium]|nr:ribonuclease R [Bacteroidia bacterium]MCO5253279.1 ribonuclease R [Bacteroidota bacterium]